MLKTIMLWKNLSLMLIAVIKRPKQESFAFALLLICN